MLRKFKNYIFNIYFRVVSSIAFYPTIIAIIFLVLSLITLWLVDSELNLYLQENYPMLVINNPDTARSILSTMIGGIISLTVFSFSMVMVLLSQASSNFSPRLLPGLISDTRNQVTLGIFLGTIIFNMIVLISILPNENTETHSGFSVLIGMIFGIICLAMFVYFIHFMSTEIQINNILDRIFIESKARINEQIKAQNEAGPIKVDNQDNWISYKSPNAGYYQGINLEGLVKKIAVEKINIKILPHKGKYTLPNTELFIYDQEIDEKTADEIHDYMVFENNYKAADNYVLGMKQLTEVGVKAMSPGINDPGTAIISIDYLTELIALRMRLTDIETYKTDDGDNLVQLATIDFKALIYQILASYRQYCKHDTIVMEKLANMLFYLRDQPYESDTYIRAIEDELQRIEVDAKENIKNKDDLNHLLALFS